MGCLVIAAAALIPWVAFGVTLLVTGWFFGSVVMWAAGLNVMCSVLLSSYRWDVDHD